MNGPSATSEPLAGATFSEVVSLPVVVDLLTAARVLGIGRTTAYALARAGEFPCQVFKVGGGYRVPTVGLLRLLGVDALNYARTSGAIEGIDRGDSALELSRSPSSARA